MTTKNYMIQNLEDKFFCAGSLWMFRNWCFSDDLLAPNLEDCAKYPVEILHQIMGEHFEYVNG